MEIEYKLFHCRFCSEEKQYHDLLDLSKDEETMEEILKATIALKIDYLNLKDRFLPKTLCERCYTSFIRAQKFLNKVKHSQDVLRSKYNLNYVDIKEENEIIDDHSSVAHLSPKCESPPPLKMDIDTQRPVEILICNKRETVTESNEETAKNHEVICEIPNNENALLDSPQKAINDKDFVDDDDVTNSYDENDNKSSSGSDNPDNKLVIINKKTSTWKQKKRHMKYDMLEFFSYAGVPIFNEEDIKSSDSELSECDPDTSHSNPKMVVKSTDKSWTSYKWYCFHCSTKFKSIVELRNHSKMEHDVCFGYSCADCNYMLMNTYNSFVEHVRQHRSVLR